MNRYCVNLLRHWQEMTAGMPLRTHLMVDSPDTGERHGLRGRAGFDLMPCPALRSKNGWDGSRLAAAARRLGVDTFLMPGRGGWDRLRFMEAARRLKPDLLFMPSPERVYFKSAKLAVVIHDLIPLIFPGESGKRLGGWWRGNFLSCLRKADLIITSSEYSKGDMTVRFGVPESKVAVIPLGFDSRLFNPAPAGQSSGKGLLAGYGIDRPYLIHVGAWQPRKNLDRLIRAFRLLERGRSDQSFQLVLCGMRHPAADKLDELVRSLALDGRVILTGLVPDSDLAELYRGAIAFVMPSLYEGFGLPVLEAMACGVPVISSDRSSLPEVMGDAAVYFDPESEEDIATAAERVTSDTALRGELIQRGLARVKQFSWEACTRATLGALRSM